MPPVALSATAVANDMERILPPSQNGSPDSGGSSGGLLGTENGINGTGDKNKAFIQKPKI